MSEWMLRFILRRDGMDVNGHQWEGYETLTLDVPELAAALHRGGFGDGCWDQTHLIGVEVLAALDAPKEARDV